MAINKWVKVGGIAYRGDKLVVSATPGDYVLNMSTTANQVVNALTITPDKYGAGDNFKVEHIAATTAGGGLLHTVATSIYNIGAGVTIMLDFAALQDIRADEVLRLTYTNAASTAMNVYTVAERIG